MSLERDPMSWERDKKKFTCPLSAAVVSLKLHTLELSLKQINKILGQIDGYLFFWPFCSEKKNM